MWRYPDETINRRLPKKVIMGGAWHMTKDITAQQLDALGYNEAIPMQRQPFTAYTTEWVKDGLVYREKIVTAVVDEEARDAAEDARDAALAAAAGLSSARLDALDRGLAAEAYRRAMGNLVSARGYFLNGWLDPLADAGEVTITNGSFVSSDGGYLTNAGADNVVTAVDLTAAQFLDEKGSITTFTVDTDSTSGHFDAPVNTRIKAGCRMVIGGADYPIIDITGDGSAANNVTFAGALAAGTYAVQAIHGTLITSGTAQLAFANGTPTNTYYPLLLPTLDCTDWTALKALSSTETLNSQSILYALSFDGGTTYSAFVSSAWLPIVRNNAGTWEYWTGSAWAASTINSALGAMAQAAGIAGNQMTGATLAGLSQAQIEGSGGFVPLTQTSLPVLVALYSASSTATPVLSAMSMTADTQANDAVFEFDSFEAVDPDTGIAVFPMEAVDTLTVGADLKAWLKRGSGAYQEITLHQGEQFDDAVFLYYGDVNMSAGTGDATQFKLTCHNNKELRVFMVENHFRSV